MLFNKVNKLFINSKFSYNQLHFSNAKTQVITTLTKLSVAKKSPAKLQSLFLLINKLKKRNFWIFIEFLALSLLQQIYFSRYSNLCHIYYFLIFAPRYWLGGFFIQYILLNLNIAYLEYIIQSKVRSISNRFFLTVRSYFGCFLLINS